jgi:hypothetical protein
MKNEIETENGIINKRKEMIMDEKKIESYTRAELNTETGLMILEVFLSTTSYEINRSLALCSITMRHS